MERFKKLFDLVGKRRDHSRGFGCDRIVLFGWKECEDDHGEHIQNEHCSVDESDLQIRILDSTSTLCMQKKAENDESNSTEEHAGMSDGCLNSSIRFDGSTRRVFRQILSLSVVVERISDTHEGLCQIEVVLVQMEESKIVHGEQCGSQCQEPFTRNKVLKGWGDKGTNCECGQVEGSSIISSVGRDGVWRLLVDRMNDGLSDELLQGVSSV